MSCLVRESRLDYIPLEKPIVELEDRISLLQHMASTQALDLSKEIESLEKRVHALRKKIFSKLNAYETVQVSRHPKRPTSLMIINLISSSFMELHGDRKFYDDTAIVGGLGMLDKHKVMYIGHQKGRGTADNIARNFGMPRPEGYRKAIRLMKLAEKFKLPIISFIDTPGAYPGIGAEERGQSEAIGHSIMIMSALKTPVISVVLGEGGSGGALAIGVANKMHMLKYAVYSVISPEGCASILLKNSEKAYQAAESLKLTSEHALKLGLVDHIIPEPLGGAHTDTRTAAQRIKNAITKDLIPMCQLSGEEIQQQRLHKLNDIKFYTS